MQRISMHLMAILHYILGFLGLLNNQLIVVLKD